MKTRLFLPFCLLALLPLSSCDTLMKIANDAMITEKPLTSEQVAQGLKQALQFGAEMAVNQLHNKDGYYLNPLLKINLPPETHEIIDHAKRIPGVEGLLEQLVLKLNRAAEDAAIQAKPILTNAITSMTIADAWGILRGEQNAATEYLKSKTFTQLISLYQPSVKNSLDKPIVAGISANQSWKEITSQWNTFANSVAGKLLGVQSVNYTLDEYVTQQALGGLFVKVAEKEKEIRTDIHARTTDLLKRVFGQAKPS